MWILVYLIMNLNSIGLYKTFDNRPIFNEQMGIISNSASIDLKKLNDIFSLVRKKICFTYYVPL